MRWQPIGACILAICAACGGQGGENVATSTSAITTSPFPKSTVFTSISWDVAHQTEFAGGSDLWPTTWGADGNIWGGWGDGGGFGGSNTVDRVSLGFAKISGTPPSIVGTNVWGNTNAGAGKATYQATFCGKPESILSVGGVLYAWIGSSYNPSASDNPACPSNPSVSNHHLAWSSDSGETWKESSWDFTDTSGGYVFNSFLQYGQDYAGAKDSYVYLYGYKNGDSNTYLARVPTSSITDETTYRVFTGLNSSGSATWSSTFDPTLSKPALTGIGGGSFFYHAATGRYIDATFYGDSANLLAMFDAPTMWGPWTTIDFETNWASLGTTGESLAITFPAKWISSDGTTMWGVFSWGDSNGDAFHLMKATLTIAGKTPPPLVTIESVSTGLAYKTATASVGEDVYIDRTYTVTSLSSSLSGGTLVQTANADKHITVTPELTLGLSSSATVHVVYDKRLPTAPAWLSGFTQSSADTFASDAFPGGVRIYSKAFAAGTVALGGNLAPPATAPVSGSNYVVVVK
jgi:hypothetical protein